MEFVIAIFLAIGWFFLFGESFKVYGDDFGDFRPRLFIPLMITLVSLTVVGYVFDATTMGLSLAVGAVVGFFAGGTNRQDVEWNWVAIGAFILASQVGGGTYVILHLLFK